MDQHKSEPDKYSSEETIKQVLAIVEKYLRMPYALYELTQGQPTKRVFEPDGYRYERTGEANLTLTISSQTGAWSQESSSMQTDRRFPIQGGLTVSWAAAERAYKHYSKHFGTDQSLERLAERGGFGVIEFVHLYYDIMSGRGKPSDLGVAQALAEADVRKA
jgi:hypothetical protein